MSLTPKQLENIQGDIWSKGFPKYYELYYFFSISDAELFSKCLPGLTAQSAQSPSPLISSLEMVRGDQAKIIAKRAEVAKAQGIPEEDVDLPQNQIPMSNALIAFSSKGLQVIEKGGPTGGPKLRVKKIIQNTDPAFFAGMRNDKFLNDPVDGTWDSLFQPEIHGLVKIGGNSQAKVEKHLEDIQTVLKHGTVINDVPGQSLPNPANSRVDGWTRPQPNRGKEHFGFEDGISQPLMDGIDKLEPQVPKPNSTGWEVNMNTDPKHLIVTKDTAKEGGDPRPDWMYDGSFLVFRKLEQDVKAFQALTKRYEEVDCGSPGLMGAKLMGRWPSGAPLAMYDYHVKDSPEPNKAKYINNFGYRDRVCPVAAHIRKTNLREDLGANNPDPKAFKTRMIRSGIAYGIDYNGHENDPPRRGLLFACYQGHIEDSFRNMQGHWADNPDFRYPQVGLDPIIGQPRQDEKGAMVTYITNATNTKTTELKFQQLVTLKGGEYFFVPSITALSGILAGAT